MASYSMEDIDVIRRRSGLSYQEAVSMLDYHNGDVLRVLIDLEKKGKLKEEGKMETAQTTYTGEKGKNKFMNFIQKMYRIRVKVQKGQTTIANLSVLYVALAVILFSPHLAILSLILGLLLGYRITIDQNDEAFRQEEAGDLVRTAADNVRNAVNTVSREIGNAMGKAQDRGAESAKEEARETREIPVNPAAADEIKSPLNTAMPDLNAGILHDLDRKMNGPNVPVIQVPVQTESVDGSVRVNEEPNGYFTASVG